LAWTHIRNAAIKAFLALEQPSGAAPRAMLNDGASSAFFCADMIQWVAQTFKLGDPLVDSRAAILTDLCAPAARLQATIA
jgi:hypothetical protein